MTRHAKTEVLVAFLALVLATAAAAILAASAPASAASRRVPCRPKRGTTTIAHSAKARIFSDARTGNDYACLYSNGHPRFLSTTEHWEYEMVRFAGPYVAFVGIAEAANTEVGVMNMRTGRVRDFREDEEVAPVKLQPSQCPSAVPNCSAVCPQVDSLVLKSDGAVAWIAVNFPPPTSSSGFCGNEVPPITEVRRHDRRGLRVIGTGSGIVASSLRLSGSTLTWRSEGATLSSNLL